MARRSNEDDFEFDDDNAFDELPANTLHQLEEKAFLSTQRPGAAGTHSTVQAEQQYAHPASSEYGSGDYDEEDVIDLNAEPISLPAKGLQDRRDDNQNNVAQHKAPFRQPSKVVGRQYEATEPISHTRNLLNGNGNGNEYQAQVSDQGRQDDVDIQALLAQVEEVGVVDAL